MWEIKVPRESGYSVTSQAHETDRCMTFRRAGRRFSGARRTYDRIQMVQVRGYQLGDSFSGSSER